jgi:hypothetical protein
LGAVFGAGGGGGGGGGGAAAGSAKNAFTAAAGSGSGSAWSRGTITAARIAIAWSATDTGKKRPCLVFRLEASDATRSAKSFRSIRHLAHENALPDRRRAR